MSVNNLEASLKKMDTKDLLNFAALQGVKTHWKAKPETIIKQIIDKVAQPVTYNQPQANTQILSKEELEKMRIEREIIKRTVHNTKEQVEEFMLKKQHTQPALAWDFNDEEHTVHVRCKGAEVCFNMDMPLTRMSREMDLHVMRGRLAPRAHSKEHFDPGAAGGKNAYTNTVLAF